MAYLSFLRCRAFCRERQGKQANLRFRCKKKRHLSAQNVAIYLLTEAKLHGTNKLILLVPRKFIMVDPKLGTKRVCEACEAKFYDLNKTPVICPKCNHSFDPMAAAAASVPVREAKPAKPAPIEDDEDELEDDDDLSLDAMAATESDDDEDEDEALEFSEEPVLLEDDDEDDDESFLEEDEDDD